MDLVSLNNTSDDDDENDRTHARPGYFLSNKRSKFERGGIINGNHASSYPPIYLPRQHGIMNDAHIFTKNQTSDCNDFQGLGYQYINRTDDSDELLGSTHVIYDEDEPLFKSVKPKRSERMSLLERDLRKVEIESKNNLCLSHIDVGDTDTNAELPATAALEALQDTLGMRILAGNRNVESSFSGGHVPEPPLTTRAPPYGIPSKMYRTLMIPTISPDDTPSSSHVGLNRCKPTKSTQLPTVSQITRQMARVCPY